MNRWPAPCVFFLLPVAYVPGIMSVSTAGRWAVVAVGAAALTLAVRVRPTPTAICVAATLAWAALGLTWTRHPWDLAGGLWHWVPLGALVYWASEQEDLTPAWRAYALGALVSLPLALLQAAGYHPVADASRGGFAAVSGLFLTSNVLAEVSVLALVASLGTGQWVLSPAFLLMAALSGRREAALMLAAAALAWCWHSLDRRRAALVTSSVITVLGGPAFWWLTDSASSDHARLSIWLSTARELSLLGRGLNSYGSDFPDYQYAHSDPLQLTYELGVGAALVFWLALRRLRRDTPALELCLFAAAAASAVVWFPLEDPATAAVVAVLAGHLSGARCRAECARVVLGARDVSRADAAVHRSTGTLSASRERLAMVPDGPRPALGARDIQGHVQPARGRGRAGAGGG